MARRNQEFQTIRSEGGLLLADLLRRVLDRSSNLAGTRPEDYGLLVGERLNEVITQSWNRLRKHWTEFRPAADNLPQNEAGTGLTNDRWNLPVLRELGFGLLPTSAGPEIEGRTYAISRFFGPVPVHLIGCGLSLDRRAAGQRGAATANPHGLVQELLNRSDAHLWALLSNGLRLRVLRDNLALSRQSFLEFDLEAMFNGEVYSDFVLLWLVVHATRFAPREGDRPETCWLERWTQESEEQGTRALGDLRRGVELALAILGEGFTGHPKNAALRDGLRSGTLPPPELHAQLLRLVYRLIFLFVAEDRTLGGQSLIHPLDGSDAARTARERYAAHYSTARLREMAGKIKGSRHGDLWHQFQLLVGAVSGDTEFETVRQALALPALGSFLWDPASTPDLNEAELTNFDLLEAMRHLAFTRQGKVLRSVDYKNLGAEELGGVYESLLALTPQVSGDGARFSFVEFAGNERKTSGSYYTPDSLVQCLLDAALDPVVEEALKGKAPAAAEQAIIALKVCDPAVGSGHFLVGAAHRLARHLARVRALAEGESEPSPLLYQHALRDVIGRCLYGVDMNPMAAELCRVSLWLEALEPGKPLSFLDHHIRVGNSLIGTTPELVAGGLPDDAFKPIEGDERPVCSQYKRQNKNEREFGDRGLLLQVAEPQAEYDTLASRSQGIDQAPDDSLDAIWRKVERFRRLVVSPEYRHQQRVADAWCAAFFWPKKTGTPSPITTNTIRQLEENAEALDTALREMLEHVARQYQFFHWQIAFPEVFSKGGFDLVVGNPPWELMEAKGDVESSEEFARMQLWFRSSRYSLLKGRRDLYKLFLVNCAAWLNPSGRLAFLTPLGVFIEDDASRWRKEFFDEGTLLELRHFQNHQKRFFPEVHASYRFCSVSYSPDSRLPHSFSTVAALPEVIPQQYLVEVPRAEFDQSLGSDRSATIYPDAPYAILHRTIVKGMQAIESVGFRVVAEFHSSTDRKLIASSKPDNGWALLKNRNIHFFNPEFAEYEAWVEPQSVWDRAARKDLTGSAWIERFPRLVFRDIARNDDERTLISCLVPPGAVSTYDTPMFLPECDKERYPRWVAFYTAAFSAHLFDFLVRPFVDKHIKGYTLARVPWPTPDSWNSGCVTKTWIVGRVIELAYTSEGFAAFSEECGWDGPPFRPDEERRFVIRCELDAAFFHVYLPADENGDWRPARRADCCAYDETPEQLAELKRHFPTARDAVVYIMDTFPIVRRKDEEAWGEYRTERVIIEFYDAMQEAIRSGTPCQTRLDPPPGPPLDADGNFISYADIADNPPPHIHLPGDAVAGSNIPLQLSDLATRFPNEPFRLRLHVGADAPDLQVRPVETSDIQATNTVVLASPNLQRQGALVPATVGRVRVESRTDASNGSAYVLVSVRGDDGLAQARFTEDEWRTLTTIGVVEESTQAEAADG